MTGRPSPSDFPAWIKRFAGADADTADGAVLVFPHAGGAAAAYRALAGALADRGLDAYILQYPQRAERLTDPAPDTVEELAAGLFAAGPWAQVGPLRLFGHCLGSLVAFEFARIAEDRGLAVRGLWASAGQAPSTVAEGPAVPTTDAEMLADIVDLGGTDPRLLADEDFVDLLLPAVRADYRAFNRYTCAPEVRIRADIHAVGGRADHRTDTGHLRRWAGHTGGGFSFRQFDGGHFYLDDHLDAVAHLVSADDG